MTFNGPTRNTDPSEALNAELAQSIRKRIVLLLADLDTADKARVLLKLQAFIADTLEALDTSTES